MMIIIRKISIKIIIFTAIFILLSITANAHETLITIVLPDSVAEPEPITAPADSTPDAPILFPVSVTENMRSGRREIVRTYELSPSENPADIPRAGFERGGYFFALADITKQENISTDRHNHTETVTVNSATQNFDAILRLLPDTQSYDNGDFTGTLTLDVSSITVTQAGTRNVGFAITETREYPHLSLNDPSLVPQTIMDSRNRTLTLSNLTWRTNTTASIDYHSISDSYTAVATYSGRAYRTEVTGYVITASYSGIIERTVADKTTYAALFIGSPLVSPAIADVEETTPEVTEISADSEEIKETGETEEPEPTTTAPEIYGEPDEPIHSDEEADRQSNSFVMSTIILAAVAALAIGLLIFAYAKQLRKKAYV